jgi:transposase
VHDDVFNDVSYSGVVVRGDILVLERRCWGDNEKLEIVLSANVGGATVTQVAQRHDLTRQQIYSLPHLPPFLRNIAEVRSGRLKST